MTTHPKWQISGFEAVAGKTGLAFSENSTLLKREQDFAEERWATIINELRNHCVQFIRGLLRRSLRTPLLSRHCEAVQPPNKGK